MNRIPELRKRKRLSQTELANMMGISQSTLSGWENGRVSVSYPDLKRLAQIFSVSVDYVTGDDEIPITSYAPTVTDDVVEFPVIGEVAAGYDHLAVEEIDGDRVTIPRAYLKGRPTSEFFVLRIKGDSMYPLYMDGDLVLVLRQSTCNYSGQIAVVVYDDEAASIKRVEYVMGQDWMRLVPLNVQFPPVKIEGEKLEHCKVLGIPQLLIRELVE